MYHNEKGKKENKQNHDFEKRGTLTIIILDYITPSFCIFYNAMLDFYAFEKTDFQN